MNLTNKHNLPQSIYSLLSKQRYSGSSSTDYSVTTLLQPPRITQLKRRHDSEVEEDAIDSVWSLFGSIAHSLLEEHGEKEALTEKRIHHTIADRVISGQVDSYHKGVITDYKVTSAWTIVYKSRFKEWTEQLNMYATLFRLSGYIVDKLEIVAILRDWDKNKAKYDSTYPQIPIYTIKLDLWNQEEAYLFLENRVLLHKSAEDLLDDMLPECSSEDMWEQPSTYAIMKEGAKRALRVFNDQQSAEIDINSRTYDTMKNDLYIQERKGKRTRCEDYCSFWGHCNQYQQYLVESGKI